MLNIEPSKNINSYLTPLVSELDGIEFKSHNCGTVKIRCALTCVGCDLPAERKTCGFLSYMANLGCSRCYCFWYWRFWKAQLFYRSKIGTYVIMKSIEKMLSSVKLRPQEILKRVNYDVGSYFDAVRMIRCTICIWVPQNTYNIWIKKDILSGASVSIINNRITSLVVPPQVQFGRLPACMDHPS